MKTTCFIRRASAALALTGHSLLNTAAAGAEPGTDTVAVTANVNGVSQYRFRGIDQTWGRPALQGGVDAVAANGLYGGIWASNVSGRSYAGGSLELDLYGGYGAKVSNDLTYSVGFYGYLYPGANFDKAACPSAAVSAPCAPPSQRYDTLEFNAGVTWNWLSYKLSVAATDYFGANTATGYSGGTRGSMYHDLIATWAVGQGWTVSGHLGFTDVKARYGAHDPDYADYRVGLAKTWGGGWNASAALVGASNRDFFRPPIGGLSASSGETRHLARHAVLLQAGRTF